MHGTVNTILNFTNEIIRLLSQVDIKLNISLYENTAIYLVIYGVVDWLENAQIYTMRRIVNTLVNYNDDHM